MTDWQAEFEKLRRNPRVPVIAIIFFGACLLWSVGSFITIFLQSAPPPPPTPDRIAAPPTPLANLHVFGIYTTALDDLPIANIGMTLEGTVVISTAPSTSQALIGNGQQIPKVYHEGDNLPGDIKINHIDEHYVIINNNGSMEKLVLPIKTVNP